MVQLDTLMPPYQYECGGVLTANSARADALAFKAASDGGVRPAITSVCFTL